jgi:hypothetical protein
VRRPARRASSGSRGLLEPEDPLDLAELGISLLESGGSLDEHLDSDAIADRHLIDKPTEIELQLGHSRPQLIAPALEVDRSLLLGQ